MSNIDSLNSEAKEKLDVVLAASNDPMVAPSDDRFVLFPLEQHDLWDMYKNHFKLLWTAEEIDMSKDPQDWEKLNSNEKHFFSHVLAFFASSDGIVNENLAARFYKDIACPEARAFYTIQMLAETVHAETYSLLIETAVPDVAERKRLFSSIRTIPIIGAKARWALEWLESSRSLAERLVAFACVEGIFFSSSFCSIYWLKAMKPGLMPGLTFSNEMIARDEGLHTDFAVALHSKLQQQCSPERITEIVTNAVKLESRFASESLPVSLIGMNAALMTQYIQFVADQLLVQFGCDRHYNVRCPFDFMAQLGMQGKPNFHEKKAAQYRRPSVGDTAEDRTFSRNADF